jgi:hypothetical protein
LESVCFFFQKLQKLKTLPNGVAWRESCNHNFFLLSPSKNTVCSREAARDELPELLTYPSRAALSLPPATPAVASHPPVPPSVPDGRAARPPARPILPRQPRRPPSPTGRPEPSSLPRREKDFPGKKTNRLEPGCRWQVVLRSRFDPSRLNRIDSNRVPRRRGPQCSAQDGERQQQRGAEHGAAAESVV